MTSNNNHNHITVCSSLFFFILLFLFLLHLRVLILVFLFGRNYCFIKHMCSSLMKRERPLGFTVFFPKKKKNKYNHDNNNKVIITLSNKHKLDARPDRTSEKRQQFGMVSP